MVWAYIIVVPLLLVGAALGVWQLRVIGREAVRQFAPGSELRSQYRRSWAVGTRTRQQWLGTGGILWVLVAGLLILEFTTCPLWFFAVPLGLLAMGWTTIAVVCTVQGVRAGSESGPPPQ